MKNSIKMKKMILALFAIATISACSEDDGYGNDNPNPVEEPTGTPDEGSEDPDPVTVNQVQLRTDATFGQVMTDADGFTLYFFAPDSDGNSNCSGGCADTWPIFNPSELTLDQGLDTADFGSITREDGGNQTTYKGWPLYRFSNDATAGTINGDGAGGVWFVAKPDYDVMITRNQLVGRDADGIETNLTASYEQGDEETFYMTSPNGRTIYHFSNDFKDENTFTNEDFSNDGVWPIFKREIINIPSIFDASDFGTINVFGETQVTYKGWPLYYFGGDENRGDNFGVGFPVAGVWPIVNTDTEPAPENEEQQSEIERTFEVGNVGATAYTFGFTDVQNPEIELERGKTYEFNVNAPGHPFLIKTNQSTGTADTFDDGVTNNGASTGTITFVVPQNAPDVLFYNCEFHGTMTGRIRIVDAGSSRNFSVANIGASSYTFSGNGFNELEDPNFTLKRGGTYVFSVNTPGHPFLIKSVQGTGTGDTFNEGVTNNGASTGEITFTVPANAPDKLFYNCEFHGSMTGIFVIID
jgi:predicted lipoprotein with Yx(FWY)xxD motif